MAYYNEKDGVPNNLLVNRYVAHVNPTYSNPIATRCGIEQGPIEVVKFV